MTAGQKERAIESVSDNLDSEIKADIFKNFSPEEREILSNIGRRLLEHTDINSTFDSPSNADSNDGTVVIDEPATTATPGSLESAQSKSSKQKPRAKKEEGVALPKGPLYDQIIQMDKIASIEMTEGDKPIQLQIASEKSIVINGREVPLSGDHLFVLNAFLKLRNMKAITVNDIQQQGFRLTNSPEDIEILHEVVEQLVELLTVKSDTFTEALLVRGEGDEELTYTVSPAEITLGFVRAGSTVTLEFIEYGDRMVFQLRGLNGFNPNNPAKHLEGVLPLAKALLGAKLGQRISYIDNSKETVSVEVTDIK